MRALPLALAAASLALTGCDKRQMPDSGSTPDETVTMQDVTTNDTTSIDAATGSDSNMAADVDVNETDNGDRGDATTTNRGRAKPRSVALPANNSADSMPEPLQPVTPPANATAG